MNNHFFFFLSLFSWFHCCKPLGRKRGGKRGDLCWSVLSKKKRRKRVKEKNQSSTSRAFPDEDLGKRKSEQKKGEFSWLVPNVHHLLWQILSTTFFLRRRHFSFFSFFSVQEDVGRRPKVFLRKKKIQKGKCVYSTSRTVDTFLCLFYSSRLSVRTWQLR